MVPGLVFGVTAPVPGEGNAILTASLAWLLVPLIVLALGTAAFMAYRRFVHPAHSVDPADDLPPLVFPMTARTPVAPARSAIAAGATAGAPAGPAPAGHAPPGAATQDAVPTGTGAKAAPRAGGRGGTAGTRGEARTPRRN
ncbi:MAG TPA: hypothetical protein VK936_09960, partial [Longimicrobiales bacterium]|nr:hypothetical protein [Longimicrobiales bacterium]